MFIEEVLKKMEILQLKESERILFLLGFQEALSTIQAINQKEKVMLLRLIEVCIENNQKALPDEKVDDGGEWVSYKDEEELYRYLRLILEGGLATFERFQKNLNSDDIANMWKNPDLENFKRRMENLFKHAKKGDEFDLKIRYLHIETFAYKKIILVEKIVLNNKKYVILNTSGGFDLFDIETGKEILWNDIALV